MPRRRRVKQRPPPKPKEVVDPSIVDALMEYSASLIQRQLRRSGLLDGGFVLV